MSNEFNETMRIEIPNDKKSIKEIIKIVIFFIVAISASFRSH